LYIYLFDRKSVLLWRKLNTFFYERILVKRLVDSSANLDRMFGRRFRWRPKYI
jgi:hypothetical protein